MRIGVDIGGSKIAAALISNKGEILEEERFPLSFSMEGEAIFAGLCKVVRSLLEKAETAGLDAEAFPRGIGIGCPGHIREGLILASPNLPGLTDFPLKERLEEVFKLPTAVENDANCAALGELGFGSLKGVQNAALLTLGSGIGGGFIVNGKLLSGASGTAGEIGHLCTHYDGTRCSCGKTGCFECYASATAFVRLLSAEALNDRKSMLWTLVNGDLTKLNGQIGIEAARQGDPAAKKALAVFVNELALGITALVNILDPEIIALGGGLSQGFDLFGEATMDLVKASCYAGESWQGQIVKASLENRAGILGAALL